MITPDAWPPLPYEDWEPTKQTIHRYCQIVGKIRMALVPFRNHWWHVTLYPTARGLSTGPMPYHGRDVEIAFDLTAHRADVESSDGRRAPGAGRASSSPPAPPARTSTPTCSRRCSASRSKSTSTRGRSTSARAPF